MGRPCRHRSPTRRARALATALLLLSAALGTRAVTGDGGAFDTAPTPVAGHQDVVAPFVATWCLACHAGEEAMAGLDLEALVTPAHGTPSALLRARPVWERVAAALEAGAMPPPDAGDPPPDRARIVKAIEALQETAGDLAPLRIVPLPPRRLSRTEWQASVKGVFGVDVNAERFLPPDELAYGFPHLVDAQTSSPARVEAYLEAAEEVARRVVVTASPERPIQVERDGEALRIERGNGGPRADGLVLSTNGDIGATFDIPRTGRYVLEAVVYGQQAGPEPARVRLSCVGGPHGEVQDVPETAGTPGTRRETLALKAGARTLVATFVNDYWRPDAKDPKDRDRNLGVVALRLHGPLAEGLGPRPPSTIQGLDDPASVEDTRRDDLVRRTIEATWRRPADADEVARLSTWIADIAKRHDADTALRALVVRALVSPHFLFLVEGLDDDPSSPDLVPVTEHELATRLSFALTSAPPDARLRDLADRGELGRHLHDEVDRLLAGPAREPLVSGFLVAWLELADFAEQRVDAKAHPGIPQDLAPELLEETRRTLATWIAEDVDVRTWFAAPTTWLSPSLAKHYGLEARYAAAPATDDGWRRVDLAGTGREGLLAQGSVLTLTSESTRTSPVKRGRWLLDVVLGRPPPPAPPGVPPLEASAAPDGPDTLRDRLARHRADPACTACHQRMDPLGFALEAFDAVGRQRDLAPEPDGAPGDRGLLPDGTAVDGLPGLRAHLMASPDLPRRFAARLLAWMLGRGLAPEDEPLVRDVVRHAAQGGHRFSAYVHAVVQSVPFRWRAVRLPVGDVADAASDGGR
ncbi:MAG: DUF1588 domain-containing protein [Planctomycetota bacterium]